MRRTTRPCVVAAIAVATVSMTPRSGVAIVSASFRAKGCSSRSTGSCLSLVFRCIVTALFWILLERLRKGPRTCSAAGAAGSFDRMRIVASSCKRRTTTNPCVMPSVYLVTSFLLKATSNWPNVSRAWETVSWLRGASSPIAKSRHHASTKPERHTRLGKASVDEPMHPQTAAGLEHRQLLSQGLYLHVLVVGFPPPLGKGGDVGAAAATVNQQVWLQVRAQNAQKLLRACLGTAQGSSTRPCGAARKKSSQHGRQVPQGSVHDETCRRKAHCRTERPRSAGEQTELPGRPQKMCCACILFFCTITSTGSLRP